MMESWNRILGLIVSLNLGTNYVLQHKFTMTPPQRPLELEKPGPAEG